MPFRLQKNKERYLTYVPKGGLAWNKYCTKYVVIHFLLPLGVLINQLRKTKEKDLNSQENSLENNSYRQMALSSVDRNILYYSYLVKRCNAPCMMSRLWGIPQMIKQLSEDFWQKYVVQFSTAQQFS